MGQDIFEMCLKELNISQDIPYEALSYSEKVMIATCYQLSRGNEIDLEAIEDILDKENMKKISKLYMELYNF